MKAKEYQQLSVLLEAIDVQANAIAYGKATLPDTADNITLLVQAIRRLVKDDAFYASWWGISVAQWVGNAPVGEPDVTGLPCGQDDAVLERHEAMLEQIELRKQYGLENPACSFSEYLAKAE